MDEIDARLEHPLHKSTTYVVQKTGVHVYVYFISREELSTSTFMEVPGMHTK
jgi:hypothetical protein